MQRPPGVDVDPRYAGFLIGALVHSAIRSLFGHQRADSRTRSEKSRLIRRLKDAEIVVMGLAAIGLTLQWPVLIYVAMFLIGLQATVFGPVKYSYLPQHLDAERVDARQWSDRNGNVHRDLARHDRGGHVDQRIRKPVGATAVAATVNCCSQSLAERQRS